MKTVRELRAGAFVPVAQYNELVLAVQELQGAGVGPGLEMHESATGRMIGLSPRIDCIWAKISKVPGDTVGYIAEGDRWKYSWVEVVKSTTGYAGWTTVTGGFTGKHDARNQSETPTKLYRFRPVPVDTVVRLWIVATGSVKEYWFDCSENQDTNLDVVGTPMEHLRNQEASTDEWSLKNNKGEGVNIAWDGPAYYNAVTGKWWQKWRVARFDDSGRLLEISAENISQLNP